MSGVAGRSGRRRDSAEAHRQRGTYRPDRHGGFDSPEPVPGDPTPPGKLSAEGRAEWRRMVERLRRTKTLSAADDAVLYQYAKLWEETEEVGRDRDQTRRLVQQLQKTAIAKLEGDTLVDAIAQIERMRARLSRLATQLRMQRLALRTYLIEFGMSPAARTRVKVPKVSEAGSSKLLAFTGGKAETA